MEKSTISMAIFNSYVDIARGYLGFCTDLSWASNLDQQSACPNFAEAHHQIVSVESPYPSIDQWKLVGNSPEITA